MALGNVSLAVLIAAAVLAVAFVVLMARNAVGRRNRAERNRRNQELAFMGAPFNYDSVRWTCWALALLSLVVFLLLVSNPVLAVLLFALFAAAPWAYRKVIETRYVRAIERGLVEAVDTWVQCLQAGMSLQQGIDVAASDLKGPIAREMARIQQDIMMSDLETALWRWNDRLSLDEVRYIVLGVISCRQSGGRMSDVIGNIAETVRGRIEMRAKVKTLTAVGRFEAIVMGFAPVVMVIVLNIIDNDTFGALYRNPIGIFGSVFMLGWMFIGFMVIWNMVNIEV